MTPLLTHTLYTFRGDNISFLSPASLRTFKEYIFEWGDYIVLYAPPSMPSRFSDPNEVTAIFQLMHRDLALKVSLRSPTPLQEEMVIRYWSAGGRHDSVEPLIAPLIEDETKNSLDLIHLMPPFARNRLNYYIYTEPKPGDPEVLRDCFWTSFNFFNEGHF